MATRKYQQSLRAESAEATRRRILEAVEDLLRKKPGAEISLEDVARTAGVARSTVYLIFGSRAGVFDALTDELWSRTNSLYELKQAFKATDAMDTLRTMMKASTEIYARIRDVAAVLFSMSALDPDSVGGAIVRLEDQRRWGMRQLAEQFAEQGCLRDDVSVEHASDVLWMLCAFPTFDALYTERGLSADAVAELLTALAARTLCR